VLLAAGLRDWVDFGVIVSESDFVTATSVQLILIPDWDPCSQRFCGMVSRKTSGRYCRTVEGLDCSEGCCKATSSDFLYFHSIVFRLSGMVVNRKSKLGTLCQAISLSPRFNL